MKILTNSQNILQNLEKININNSEELLMYLPYRYENNSYTDLTFIEDKQKITVLGKLVSNPKHFSNGKIDIITFFFITTDNHFFNIKIFNRGYLIKQLKLGEIYSLIGTYAIKNKEINVQSFVKGIIPGEKKIRSVYHLPQSLSQSTYRKLVEKTYNTLQDIVSDYIPSYLKEKYRLLDKKEALKLVHFPETEEDIAKGLRTLKYHECLTYSLKNRIIRGENKRRPKIPKGIINTQKINDFIKNLSYKLTSDQIKAIREIILDMNEQSLMYRLLQGDVGTGKTIVSGIALYGNYLRNKVGAFMVPTDSLARQQYESFKNLFSNYGINVGLLIGGLSNKEKKRIKEDLMYGKIDIIVGTHALFSEDVYYPSLGLVVIDEQHRFGVNQRNELVSKDDGCDLLLMSATPIPRTLALSVYGDLDISSLSEFPNKERKVITEIVCSKSPKILDVVKENLMNKRQIFIVAPKILDKDDDLNSAERIFEIYNTLFESQVRILHGKMRSEEKNKILEDFIKGDFLILVSTTVIELGINVLNAGAIIIYSASSFGLASLHQLRGRVGRNGSEAICLLVDDENSERLQILEKSSDGFEIAEMDMKLRGPGDVIGTSQSGFPTFACLNIIDDFKIFECARDDAALICSSLHKEENRLIYNYVLDEMKHDSLTLFD